MSAAIMELNKIVDSMDESQIDKILSYAKFIRTDLTFNKVSSNERIVGLGKGMFKEHDDIDFCNDEIAEMFGVK